MKVKITNHGLVFGLSMFMPILQYIAYQKTEKNDITLDEVFNNLKNKLLSDTEKLNKDKTGMTLQDLEILSSANQVIPHYIKAFESGTFEYEN